MAVTAGDVVLARLRYEDGDTKLRPALALAILPGAFQTVLVCGITTRLDQFVGEWDELLGIDDPDFGLSGLHQTSTIRLSFLATLSDTMIRGRIGNISDDRLQRIRQHLANRIALK